MSEYCDLSESIFDNVHVTCDVPEGYEDQALFVLRSDIDFAKVEDYRGKVPTGNTAYTKYDNTIVIPVDGSILKDNKKGAVVYQLKNAFSGTTAAFEEGDVKNTITETVAFNIWSNDPKAGQQIDDMLNSTYVAILKQQYKGTSGNSNEVGGAVYRVFGLSGSGLKMTGADQDSYSDSNVGWTLTFQSTGSNKSMQFLQAVDADNKISETAMDGIFESMKQAE